MSEKYCFELEKEEFESLKKILEKSKRVEDTPKPEPEIIEQKSEE